MGVESTTWPEGLRPTRLRKLWFARFEALEPGLTLRQLAERMTQHYASVAFWAKCFKYSFSRLQRGRKSLIDWNSADWSLKNCELARHFGVSGERVRQIRQARNLPPAQKQSDGGRMFREYIASHRRQLHKLSIRRMIANSGAEISTATAYEILKNCGIKLRSHVIPWEQINWALSDGDLASTWGTHRGYVARMRVRFGGGQPRWNGEVRNAAKEKACQKAIDAERAKAQGHRRLPRTNGKVSV